MDKILITGISGMIGQSLKKALELKYDCVGLSTNKERCDGKKIFFWNPSDEILDLNALEGVKGIIHLSGFPVSKPWNDKNKKLNYDSRVRAAHLLLRSCAEVELRPEFFISASGIGYYGIERKHPVNEFSLEGKGYLAELCKKWEDAALSFEAIGTRVVVVRTPVVVSPEGGIIQQLKPIFNLGLGTAFGKGTQPMPWVHIHDLVRFYIQAIDDTRSMGPYNLCHEEVPDFNNFCKEIAKSLGKPYFLPNIPGFLLKILMGERSSLFLDNPDVKSIRLKEMGFEFEVLSLDGVSGS